MALDIEPRFVLGRLVHVLVHATGAGCLPTRDHDWAAVDYDRYDGAPDAGPQRVGYGATREAAIADLIARIEEDEE